MKTAQSKNDQYDFENVQRKLEAIPTSEWHREFDGDGNFEYFYPTTFGKVVVGISGLDMYVGLVDKNNSNLVLYTPDPRRSNERSCSPEFFDEFYQKMSNKDKKVERLDDLSKLEEWLGDNL